MDTKSKSIKSSRAYKALLAVLFIVCWGTLGIVTGFAGAYGYMYPNFGGVEALLIDSADDSDIYAGAVMTATQYSDYCENWARMKRNMQIILATDVLLLAAGIVLMVMLCRCAGVLADGTARLGKRACGFRNALAVRDMVGMRRGAEQCCYARRGRQESLHGAERRG